ncbi:MAG TPA: hypothetical protein VMB74_16725 [Streptosporangiaceae bacterium]|nr:hypothetical protein [Streptosporangiaceae bacterium]
MARLIGWLVVAFVVFYLLTDPDGAATLVQRIFDDLRTFAESLATFVSHL